MDQTLIDEASRGRLNGFKGSAQFAVLRILGRELTHRGIGVGRIKNGGGSAAVMICHVRECRLIVIFGFLGIDAIRDDGKMDCEFSVWPTPTLVDRLWRRHDWTVWREAWRSLATAMEDSVTDLGAGPVIWDGSGESRSFNA